MGIRRRRKKLSTQVGRLDQRIKSVELRPINLLTSTQVAAAIEDGEIQSRPDVLVTNAAPYEWTSIQDAYYYPRKLTGENEDRVEIYLEADLDNLNVGGRLAVEGIHGTQSFNIDVDGDNFTVLDIDAIDGSSWTGRPAWKHDPASDQLSGVTVTNTYTFKPETVGPVTWTTRQRLQTRRAVDSFEITGTTVTLTMNADHKFEVGDIFYTNILSDQANNDESRIASGIDGKFYITAITNNTIEYELVAGVDTPTGTITPTADVYVFPVARRWAQVGSIWVDSANNETYYWDGIRWVEYTPTSDVGADGDPPSPPTGLTITSDITFYNTSLAVSKVTVGWTAPTTSVSGNPITDLAGYKIRWRELVTDDWKVLDIGFPTTTSYTFDGSYLFKQGTLYYFEVYAYDSGRQDSTALTGTHTTSAADPGAIDTLKPTPPSISSYLGTITLTWDGLMDTNPDTSPPDGVVILEIHRSLSTGFSVSDSTLIGTVAARANTKFVVSDVTYGTDYYFRFRLRNASGVLSLPSDEVTGQTSSSVDASEIAAIIDAAGITPGTVVSGETIVGLSITGQLIQGLEIQGDFIKANSIEADRLDVGTLAARFMSSDIISTSATQTGARVDIDSSGISAYNIGGSPTFTVNAATGQVTIASGVTIGGYATNSNVTAVEGTANTANSTANSAQSTATTANNTANSASSDASNAIANVQAVQNAVYFPGTTQINGGSIRTGTIVADALAGSSVTDFIIAGNEIATSQINPRVKINNAGFFMFSGAPSAVVRMYTANSTAYFAGDVFVDGYTNGAIRTSTSFPRVELDSSTYNGIRFRYSSSSSNRLTSASGSVTLTADNFDVTNLGSSQNSNSYYVVVSPFSGRLVRGNQYSDERLKDDIYDLPLGLDFIKSISPVTFSWKKDSSKAPQVGVIAQEIIEKLSEVNESYVPIFVGESSDTPLEDGSPSYTLNYSRFVPVLLKAVKELSSQVDSLKEEVEYLKSNQEK